jgi:FkbM family methyltransferase
MFKKIAKEIMPPFVHSMLRRIIKKENRPYHPSWHTIKSGILQGRQICLDPRDGLWQEDMIEGSYDRFFFDYLQGLNLKGKTVFDIGAHVGYHTLHFASLVGNKGLVCAFEPNHFNRSRLSINLEQNPDLAKRIRIFDVALSDQEGQEEFYFCRDVDKGTSSGSFISRAHTFYPKSKEYLALFEMTTVKTVCLDKIASYIGPAITPHVLKIDVEGAETSVLQGGQKMLKIQRPLIIMEVHSIYNMLKTYEILHAVNYSVRLLKEELDGRCFIAAEPQVNTIL